MCPGSTIVDTMSYKHYLTNKAKVPTSKGAPYLQVMAKGNPAWCDNLEKAERKWSNLLSVSKEGWMISQNTHTKNLECLAHEGVCVNTLVNQADVNNIIDNPSNLVLSPTLILTGMTNSICQYKNGFNAACPEEFSSIEHNRVNNLLQTLQLNAMRSPIH